MIQEKSIEEVIETLVDDNDGAAAVCLELYLTDNFRSLYYLDYLNIKGKDLETLATKCCDESSFKYLVQTIRFLRSGFLGNDEIQENLKSANPVHFINRLITNGEDWENTYEEYAGYFRKNLKQNKGR